MSESLRQKTLPAFIWSAINRFGNKAIRYIVLIIIARILMPSDFGLVGMLAIFLAISQSFLDSGFSKALIQKKDSNNTDFSTIFYFNIIIGLIIYAILFFSAPLIANFYNQPILVPLTRILGLNLVINSFGLIQTTILTKRIDFKTQTRISLLSIVISGA